MFCSFFGAGRLFVGYPFAVFVSGCGNRSVVYCDSTYCTDLMFSSGFDTSRLFISYPFTIGMSGFFNALSFYETAAARAYFITEFSTGRLGFYLPNTPIMSFGIYVGVNVRIPAGAGVGCIASFGTRGLNHCVTVRMSCRRNSIGIYRFSAGGADAVLFALFGAGCFLICYPLSVNMSKRVYV